MNVSFNGEQKTIVSSVSVENQLGYIPFLGTASGAYRIIRNVIEIVGFLVAAILRPRACCHAASLITHRIVPICRGVIELVPFAGGLSLYAIDRLRILLIERQISSNGDIHPSSRYYYVNGFQIMSSATQVTYESDFSFIAQAR